jgi:putative flippase GtrA
MANENKNAVDSSGKKDGRGIVASVTGLWKSFSGRHQTIAQFLVFFLLSNGITVIQMVFMPLLKGIFQGTALVSTDFRIWPVGHNLDGSVYYIFNYPAGLIENGGGGGLAYFLAVQITLGFAQVVNFFAQRNITFKSNGNPWRSAFWYLIAYIVITIVAAAAQGVYKVPIYSLLMKTWGLGGFGETIADFITMFINSAISFWVFFPIFKIIFRNDLEAKA